ncbi:head-tail connector protein [Ralstonia mannitolilytica]|uniref:head-tail connector protein n=1 Tax=Ralstonia mannitolilytica TaxID=105219 RepID=UPI0028F4E2F9|nr:head-tail connector protein [Ralstonia mannitolilytica]CAJ0740825.1 hypothetical protein R76696_03159 [Ralstonia mannitolilytica]
MIEISEIRSQLRIEPDETDDALLKRYLGAAIARVENRTNRKLYPADGPLPADAPANALQMDDSIALALLLLIGHFDKQRSATSDGVVASIPIGVDALIEPYRWFFDWE